MAHQDAPILQLFIQFSAADLVGSGEEEIGLAGQNGEAHLLQRDRGALPGGDDGGAFLPVIALRIHGGLAEAQGQTVDVV